MEYERRDDIHYILGIYADRHRTVLRIHFFLGFCTEFQPGIYGKDFQKSTSKYPWCYTIAGIYILTGRTN